MSIQLTKRYGLLTKLICLPLISRQLATNYEQLSCADSLPTTLRLSNPTVSLYILIQNGHGALFRKLTSLERKRYSRMGNMIIPILPAGTLCQTIGSGTLLLSCTAGTLSFPSGSILLLPLLLDECVSGKTMARLVVWKTRCVITRWIAGLP